MAKQLLRVFAVAILAASWSGTVGAKGFAAPPPNLLFQLQKQNHGRPWLRVMTDSSRLTLRVSRIGESGLSGISSAKSEPPAPDPLGWNSIARIDEVVTRAQIGRIAGFALGGALGAGLGKAIGESMRSYRTDPLAPNGTIYSRGHGRAGLVLGLALLGGVGAWQGGRFGKRMEEERSWYVAVPREVSSPFAGDTSAAITSSSAVLPPPGKAPSPSVLRACARIDRDDLIRMRGDFEGFRGFASEVGPEGIRGLRGAPARGRRSATSVPTELITWDRIDRVDKLGRGWRMGALIGGLALGAAGAYIGYEGLGEYGRSSRAEAIGGAAIFFGYCGVAGAVLGAGVGAIFPAWHRVYIRPVAAAAGR